MIEILEKYHKDGLLHKQFHPTYPLIIWNYSPRVQYEKLWTPLLMMCRGLVTDFDGKIIARPFPKFFNYEEHKPEDIPNENYVVYEKMDGSLGILFYYEEELSDERRYNIWFNNNYETGMERFFDPNNLPDYNNSYYEPTPKTKGEWILATRGSFTSSQAIKGKEILDNKYDVSSLRKGRTYLFEIIYPENRIVVDYGNEEKLVLLGVIDTESGEELPNSAIFFMQEQGFEIVTTYKTWGEGYDLLKEEISNNREGYVIRFKNGFRMKIKGEEYKRLHKILTNISNRDIWEYLKDDKPLDDILDKVPDEFYDWVKGQVSMFTEMFNVTKTMTEFIFYRDIKDTMTRREAAETILSKDKNYHPILFKLLDGKDPSDLIWKNLYPSYSKPFKKDEN